MVSANSDRLTINAGDVVGCSRVLSRGIRAGGREAEGQADQAQGGPPADQHGIATPQGNPDR